MNNHQILAEALEALGDEKFQEVLFLLKEKYPKLASHLHSRCESLSTRALDLIQYAESRNGKQMAIDDIRAAILRTASELETALRRLRSLKKIG